MMRRWLKWPVFVFKAGFTIDQDLKMEMITIRLFEEKYQPRESRRGFVRTTV